MDGPEGLNALDPGVILLAKALEGCDPRTALLVHCGELPGVGAGATRLVLDVREHTRSVHRCVPVALDDDPLADREFEVAACWPRAHLGMDFSLANLAYGATHLRVGGRLLCSARKQKGGKRLAAMMQRLLGNVEVVARDRGYHLYVSERRDQLDEALAEELGSVRYEIQDARLGPLSLESAPGVFSRKALDAGTATLIEHLTHDEDPEVTHVLDLGTGIGPLALFAASRWEQSRVLGVDASHLAIELARKNADRAGLGGRTELFVSDGLTQLPPAVAEHFRGHVDLALVNPPTHASPEGLSRLLQPLAEWISPSGRVLCVVNRPGRATASLEAAGLQVHSHRYPNFWVLAATRP